MMKSDQDAGKLDLLVLKTASLALIATMANWTAISRAETAAGVTLWDTLSPLSGTVSVAARSDWKPVPTDLLALEVNSAKARSDPAYYGRDYAFKGDAVVENQRFLAVFRSGQGKVILYSKGGAARQNPAAPGNATLGRTIFECVPLQMDGAATRRLSHFEIVRNAGDEVVLDVAFSAENAPELSARFSFDKTAIVAIKPAEPMQAIRLHSPVRYGVLPSFIGDDLIYRPADYPASTHTLFLPSENLFLGLLTGENGVLVMTWPAGKQRLSLQLSKAPQGHRLIQSLDFENDGQSVYLAALEAPGLWHQDLLKPSYLEKDVAIPWKRPFPAKWVTQLFEGKVKTTFRFRDSKSQIWRGVLGSYSYPVWFEGENAFYHLSKKVPPKGESVVYYLEGQNTPASILTPVDIMKATLGRPMCETLFDLPGRKLRTHHRRAGAGVRRACTCGCTEAIQAVFKTGKEFQDREYIHGALEDMIYFVERHLERIHEYRQFAQETIGFLRTKRNAQAKLRPFLDRLMPVVQQIPREFNAQKENMQSVVHAQDLARRTMALAGRKTANNLKAYMELFKAWRRMGGAQDYVLAQCHTIARQLLQEAGYACAQQPEAVALAKEIRTRCKRVLRNPDGYEIWPNY